MAVTLPEIYTQHETEDQPITHRVTLGQLARLEAKFPEVGSGIMAFGTGSIRYFSFLGWLHRKQTGTKVGDFEKWADGLVDVGLAKSEDDEDGDDAETDAEDPTEADSPTP